MPRYTLAVVNGTVVLPYVGMVRCDVGIRDGRIAALADAIPPSEAEEVLDARGEVVLPGAVDSHFHLGIYRDLARDARSETASALVGDEVDWLVGQQGVGPSKYYMFYKGLNLTSDSTRGSDYTMAEAYDLGHLYLLMERVTAASSKHGAHGRVSLSLHCEQAELIRVFIEEVKRVSGGWRRITGRGPRSPSACPWPRRSCSPTRRAAP
jgi:dihydropyrimidinase/allantoinase